MAHPQVLRDMALFVEVAKRKSFSQAAAALDVPISSLSRRITQFEAAIGLRLLDRTTRKLVLTSYGEAYYEQATRLVEEAERTFDDLIAQARGPSGLLKLAAPSDPWVLDHVSSVVSAYCRRHEHVRVHVDLRPTMVDLAQEGYDLAIAVEEPRETSLIARRVAQIDNGLFAAPAHLDRAGTPAEPRDLAGHPAILPGLPSASSVWRLTRDGDAAVVPAAGIVSCNSVALARRFAAAGHGIALLQETEAQAGVEAGELRRVLPEWNPAPTPVYIVTTSRLLPAKTRSFIDFASKHLALHLAGHGPGDEDDAPQALSA
ncbi:LysR family transcriptional regulator [uncultured Methylobacterium sp.]|uniref:LysR family transcriptional regulator n=1 Tax=uncultured Methylobacterium sp. TaxID=157278 RepID=UPI00261BFEE6|nr:LysR family transcriptional regulator [uncultured Methylobacterium sp.]